MKSWYFTLTKDHARRADLGADSGYIEVRAENETKARDKIWDRLGAAWSFQYTSVDQIHELDRRCLEVIL